MIPSSAEIRENLVGSLGIMLGRADALARVDLSVAGFWRSFSAIVLLLPFLALALISERVLARASGQEIAAFTAADVWVDAAALLVDWIAFPLIFALIAGPFGLGARYVPYIVVRNWASVVIAAILSVIHVLAIVSVLPPQLASILSLAAIGIALRFAYVVARTTLLAPMGVVLPIVILDFLVSFTIWSVAGTF